MKTTGMEKEHRTGIIFFKPDKTSLKRIQSDSIGLGTVQKILSESWFRILHVTLILTPLYTYSVFRCTGNVRLLHVVFYF